MSQIVASPSQIDHDRLLMLLSDWQIVYRWQDYNQRDAAWRNDEKQFCEYKTACFRYPDVVDAFQLEQLESNVQQNRELLDAYVFEIQEIWRILETLAPELLNRFERLLRNTSDADKRADSVGGILDELMKGH